MGFQGVRRSHGFQEGRGFQGGLLVPIKCCHDANIIILHIFLLPRPSHPGYTEKRVLSGDIKANTGEHTASGQ